MTLQTDKYSSLLYQYNGSVEQHLPTNESLYQGSGLHKLHSYLFLLPLKKFTYFVIDLVSIEKLVSVEDALSALLRDGR